MREKGGATPCVRGSWRARQEGMYCRHSPIFAVYCRHDHSCRRSPLFPPFPAISVGYVDEGPGIVSCIGSIVRHFIRRSEVREVRVTHRPSFSSERADIADASRCRRGVSSGFAGYNLLERKTESECCAHVGCHGFYRHRSAVVHVRSPAASCSHYTLQARPKATRL